MKITENYIIYVILHYHSVNTHSVEHAAVNRRVVGSSPTWGAKKSTINSWC